MILDESTMKTMVLLDVVDLNESLLVKLWRYWVVEVVDVEGCVSLSDNENEDYIVLGK